MLLKEGHVLGFFDKAPLIVTILFGMSSTALASVGNLYIGPNAAGSSDGSNCANARIYSIFNDPNNWGQGASQIGPGSVVHLCGTFNGTAGQTLLTFQGSGTQLAPITLLFEANAKLLAPYWGTGEGLGAAIRIIGENYVTVDGGVNGVIQNTLNGTPGSACPAGTCSNPAHDSDGIEVQDCTGCTIRNLTIADIYDKTTVADENGFGRGISKGGRATGLTVSNVTIHDAGFCLFYGLPDSSADANFAVQNSDMSRCSTGLAIAGSNGNTGTLTGVTISNNKIHDLKNWNDTAYSFHHDGVHIWAYASTAISGVNVYDNQFYGDLGQGTAWLYYENYSGFVANITIFNNIFQELGTTCTFNCGPYSIWLQNDTPLSVINAGIYNNTLIGDDSSIGGITVEGTSGIHYDLRNNIIMGFSNMLQVQGSSPLPLSSSDYNDWYFQNSEVINIEVVGSYVQANFANWMSKCGCDLHSTTGNPQLTATYLLANTQSAAWNSGMNLTSLAIPALTVDFTGATRPASGPWNMGATGLAPSSGGGVQPPGGLLPPMGVSIISR